MSGETPATYHERQFLELCALHTLNNLFQRQEFTRQSLDEFCRKLSPDSYSWWNPHRSPLGLGNYDINVVISALQSRGLSAMWFDRRKNPANLDLSKIFGFIRNLPSRPKLGFLPLPFFKRRHWVAVRQLDNIYYNFDSKLSRPELIGGSQELVDLLKRSSAEGSEEEIFVIVTKEIEADGSWFKQSRP